MDGPFETISDYILATFVAVVLGIVTTCVIFGNADDLRRGVRTIFAEAPSAVENYKPARLRDYADGDNDAILGASDTEI